MTQIRAQFSGRQPVSRPGNKHWHLLSHLAGHDHDRTKTMGVLLLRRPTFKLRRRRRHIWAGTTGLTWLMTLGCQCALAVAGITNGPASVAADAQGHLTFLRLEHQARVAGKDGMADAYLQEIVKIIGSLYSSGSGSSAGSSSGHGASFLRIWPF